MIPVTFENKTTNKVKDSPDNLAPMENSQKDNDDENKNKNNDNNNNKMIYH